MKELTDTTLLARCRSGDEGAWRALVERYSALILSIPRRYGLKAAQADDVLGEVCLSLVRALHRIRDPQALPKWLIRTTTRATWEASRKSKLRSTEDLPPLTGAAPPEEFIGLLEEEQLVREALTKISERCRRLLELLYFKAPTPSYDEVASAIGSLLGVDMGTAQHADFTLILDSLAGRGQRWVDGHLETCSSCAAQAEKAARLLAAGRRALSAPKLSKKAMKRAMRVFREHLAPQQPVALRLVLDSLLRPAPTLRATKASPTRFLRYEGAATVELQVTPAVRGVEVRGQVTPASHADEVVLRVGRTLRRGRVAKDGTFILRGVPRGEVEIRVGPTRITGLAL
ncbi:MAG: RNA polymerase sigma factor [Planctomycetota bacterium]